MIYIVFTDFYLNDNVKKQKLTTGLSFLSTSIFSTASNVSKPPTTLSVKHKTIIC